MADNYDDPRARRDGHYDHVNGFKEETRRQIEALRAELGELKSKRRDLRMSAATTAGVLGLRYIAETNEYVRMVRSVDHEIVLPDIVPKPEPLAPEVIEPRKSENKPVVGEFKPAGSRWLVFTEIMLWLFTVVIGGFVGLGLLMIVGMNWKAYPGYLLPGLLVGVSVLSVLKLMVSFGWRFVGHAHALGRPYGWKLALCGLVTIGACAADANLGAMALHEYLKDRSFTEANLPDYWKLVLLAVVVTTPLLIASGFLAYEKAHREPSREEREQARHEREAERREAEHRDRLAKQEAERAKHRAALQSKVDGDHASQVDLASKKYEELKRIDGERTVDWEEYRNNAEYKCLQGLIGQIAVLTFEIAEKERELTNYKISRGYEKSAEFPNGKSAAAPVEVEEKKDDEDKPFVS